MPVETRLFGPDGTPVSLLGFGCGSVDGLMVRGTAADQERAFACALEAGINYFDDAVQYGDGASEQHLGGILRRLGAKEALVGTKVRLRSAEFGRIAAAVAASLDGSLRRLQRDHVDIFHRVLAGGALSGLARRQSVASPEPEPIGSALSYKAELSRASRLMPLVTEGFATSSPEAATRFAIAHPAMGTILVGMASVDEFEAALGAVLRGPLPAAALHRIAELTAGFSGESR